MKKFLWPGVILLAILVSAGGTARADVEKTLEKKLSLEKAPLDLAISSDGRRIFVLTEGGRVEIYSAAGELQDILAVDSGTDRLAVSPAADRIYLLDSKGKTVQIASVAYIHDIDIAGSPFQGPAEAPVTIVAFSDFQ